MTTLDPRALTRPIIGIENRTAQEVFDIMSDRFRALSPPQAGESAEKPYAYEFGRSNGDDTYSVFIERSLPAKPHPDWPVKPLYASPQPANPAQVMDAMVKAARRVLPPFKAPNDDTLRTALTAALPTVSQVAAWRPLTHKDGKMTCPMPADETVVEAMLQDGTVCRAWYSCNIMDAGDWDFMPVKDDGEPDGEADSLDPKVVAWRALSHPHPADERVVEALKGALKEIDNVTGISDQDANCLGCAENLIRQALSFLSAKEGR